MTLIRILKNLIIEKPMVDYKIEQIREEAITWIT